MPCRRAHRLRRVAAKGESRSQGRRFIAHAFSPLTLALSPRGEGTLPGRCGPLFIPSRSARVSDPAAPPALLSGGNPQIAKAYGDAPVQAYIAAMPGWKSDVGRRLDALIERAVPGVIKAVKWNSPFYGVEDQGWFLSFHTYTNYIKVAFFRGRSLRPVPPGESKHKEVRYVDIHEGEPLDEAQLTDWVKQASRLPGEKL